nr:MAG TPA: hypothetical protein [Caudoviricetes sp.]
MILSIFATTIFVFLPTSTRILFCYHSASLCCIFPFKFALFCTWLNLVTLSFYSRKYLKTYLKVSRLWLNVSANIL